MKTLYPPSAPVPRPVGAHPAKRDLGKVEPHPEALRRATGTPYVGDTTMLDLERSCVEEKKA